MARAAATDRPREETSKSGSHGTGEVPGDHDVAAPQMLAVDHALTDPVADVEALQLLAATPVVVPDDEVGLVPDASSVSEPSVGQVVVLGGRLDPAVEAAELEQRCAVKRHRLGVEDERNLPGVLARDRVVVRRRNDGRIALRPHPAGHDRVRISGGVAEAPLDPRRLDGAVVVRKEDDLVVCLLQAQVERTAQAGRPAADPARTRPREPGDDVGDVVAGARVDDEDLARPGLTACERLEARSDQLRPADRRQHDGDRRRRRAVGTNHGKNTRCRMLPVRRPISRPSRTASGASSALVRAFERSAASRAHDLSTAPTVRRCIPALR